jgi:hypothetical protein
MNTIKKTIIIDQYYRYIHNITMGFIEKIKSSVEMWRIDKYTKRRPVTSPDFEQKGNVPLQ